MALFGCDGVDAPDAPDAETEPATAPTGSAYPMYAAFNVLANQNDFPIVRVANSSAFNRAYMNEDDWRVDRLSRRNGDWRGDITTYNFSTNAHQTLDTRLDANDHALFSSDNVFSSSGFRQANRATVDARTGNGTTSKRATTNGFTYEFVRKMI